MLPRRSWNKDRIGQVVHANCKRAQLKPVRQIVDQTATMDQVSPLEWSMVHGKERNITFYISP